MLDYIKQQLQAMNPAPQEEAIQEQLMDQAVLECAHLFQEFDDLTMNGTITNGARQFANVDIPLQDDLEITSVEMDLLSGRVVDVPMDATVQEFTYGQMKTFDDFLQEAFDNTSPMGRETRDVYEDRCYHIAEMEYKKYSDYIIQEGLFGFDKIKIDDPRVPTEAKMHCGMRKGEPYVVYLDVYFIVDKKHRLTKKQLESINVFKSVSDSPMSGEVIQKVVFEQYGGMCGCPSMKDIWDYAKPTKLVVPVEPTDMYCVLIEFEFNDIEQKKRLCWMVPIKGKGKSATPPTKDFASSLKAVPSGKFSNLHGITKKEGKKHIAESASVTLRELNRFGNSGYYQEGIDFGDPNEAPAAEPDNSSVAQSEAPAPDANAAGGDVSAPPAEGAETGAPKEVANVNNVSDAIAEKVSDETQNDAAEEGLNVDGVDDATSDADVSDIDTSEVPSESEVDADLGDVDANAEDGGEATSDVDVDNMTPEELKAAAADKIEKMTFQQIKDFLNNQEAAPATDEVPAADGEVQEAFFLTRGNIGKELDIHLRKTLGILNDSDMEIEQLCSEFRKQGKRLNRVVHKATKMTDVFNEVERKQLLKLNALLTDLMAMMRADLDRQGVQAVKRLIRAFVQQATGVAKLVEQHKPGKPVQEGFFDKFGKKDSNEEKLPSDPDEALSAIERKLDGSLPDEFKKAFKSKMYQDMIGVDIELKEPGDPDDEAVNDLVHGIIYTLFDANQILKYTKKEKDLFDKRSMIQIATVEHGAYTVAYTPDKLYEITRNSIRPSSYRTLKEFIDALNKGMNKKSSNKPVQEAATESSSSLKLPEDYREFLRSGDYKKYKDVRVADEADTIIIHKFFSEAEIQTEAGKLSGLKVESPYDGKPHEMIPIASASCEGSKHDYVVIIDYHGQSRYCSLCMKTADGVPALFMLAHDLKFLKSLIDNPLK